MNLFQPIVSFLRWAALELSRADGKPGLSVEDFKVVVGWVQTVNSRTKTVEENGEKKQVPLTGREKTFAVAGWVLDRFGDRLPDWTSRIITWAAFHVAKRKKLV